MVLNDNFIHLIFTPPPAGAYHYKNEVLTYFC
jgi:hypothetical protein